MKDSSNRVNLNLVLGILAVVNAIIFVIALVNDRHGGPAVGIACVTLILGVFLFAYFANTTTGRRTSSALGAVTKRSTGSGSVKVVTVRHNGYPEHLARKVQAEISKQQRQGYELVSQQQDTSGWMTPNATLTFKKR